MAGTNATALYETGTNLRCVSFASHTKLKSPPPLQSSQALSVHCAMGHDLNHVRLIHCGIVLSDTEFMHTFVVCKTYRKNWL